MNILFLFSAQALAQSVVNSHDFYPVSSTDAQDQLLTYSAEETEQQTGGVGLLFEYDVDPFVLYSDSGSGAVKTELISDLLVANLYGHYALTDRLSVQAGLPVWLWQNGSADTSVPAVGDVRLSAPYYLGSLKTIGLSVVPQLSLPTNTGSDFLGSDLGGGGVVAASTDILRFGLDANLGYQFQAEDKYLNLDGNDRLVSSLGVGYLLDDELSLHVETSYRPTLTPSDVAMTEAPVEGSLYLRGNGFTIGASSGLSRGVGAPTMRLFAGLSTSFGGKQEEVTPPPTPVDPPVIEPEVWTFELKPIYFDFDKSDIREEYVEYLSTLSLEVVKYNVRLLITSGTDVRGTDPYNEVLAQKRAESTVNFLLAHGVPLDSLSYLPMGERALKIIDCRAEDCHQQNRYAEFAIEE